MADSSKYYAQRTLTTSSSAWTAVTVPTGIVCSQIILTNEDATNAHKIRTDTADATTEKNLAASGEHVICSVEPTFVGGDVVCSVKAVAGTGPVVACFIR